MAFGDDSFYDWMEREHQLRIDPPDPDELPFEDDPDE